MDLIFQDYYSGDSAGEMRITSGYSAEDSRLRLSLWLSRHLHSAFPCLPHAPACLVCVPACLCRLPAKSHSGDSAGELDFGFRLGSLAACILHFFACLLSLLVLSICLLAFTSLPPFRLLGFCSFARLMLFLPCLLFALLFLCVFTIFSSRVFSLGSLLTATPLSLSRHDRIASYGSVRDPS